MSFTQAQVYAACRIYGPQLSPLPAGVDGVTLLWALSGNESSFGADVTPRHEPAYDTDGPYAGNWPMPELLAKYGSAAACSYGPWQILLANAPSYSPTDFNDINKAAQATVAFLNSQLRQFKPQSLSDIGSIWNGGHIIKLSGLSATLVGTAATPAVTASVTAYVNKLALNYVYPKPPSQEV
jgi:hypothetical protein